MATIWSYWCNKCDWLWENPSLMHKGKCLEIRNSIIQSVISREGSKLHTYNSLQIYSYFKMSQNVAKTMAYIMNQSGGDFKQGDCLQITLLILNIGARYVSQFTVQQLATQVSLLCCPLTSGPIPVGHVQVRNIIHCCL